MSRGNLKAVPTSSRHAVALIEEQMRKTGALLLGAGSLLRDLGDGADKDDIENVAILLDMAIEEGCNTAALDLLKVQS